MINTLPASVIKNKKLNFKLTAVFDTIFSLIFKASNNVNSQLANFQILMQFYSIVVNIIYEFE